MTGRVNMLVAAVAVAATCAAAGFGYAWWTLKQSQEARQDTGDGPQAELRKRMAGLRIDVEAMERQRAELKEKLSTLPSIERLQLDIEGVREKTRSMPNSSELRREAVGIKPDGSHVNTGEIPPTVLNRMNEELGLSPQELRKLNGQ